MKLANTHCKNAKYNSSGKGNKLVGPLRENQPGIPDAEIKQAARNFMGFLRVLKEVDMEQKAK